MKTESINSPKTKYHMLKKTNIGEQRISTQISPNMKYRISTQIEPQISTQSTQISIESIKQAPK